jgi:hypothetical protein
MARNTTQDEDIDFHLRSVRANVEALPRVEQRWNNVNVPAFVTPDDLLADRISFRDEWRASMDRLKSRLHRPFRAGRLSDAQARSATSPSTAITSPRTKSSSNSMPDTQPRPHGAHSLSIGTYWSHVRSMEER